MTIIHKIENLSRPTKKHILFLINLFLIVASLTMAFALRYGMTFPLEPIRSNWALFPAMLLSGAFTIWAMRLNNIKIKTVESNTVLRLAVSAIFFAMFAMAVSFLFKLSAPRSVPLIFGAIFFMSSVIVHFLGRYTLEFVNYRICQRIPVAIYGAGDTGEQLASALAQNGDNKPICFIDDNHQLHGMVIGGLKVYSVNSLPRLIKKHGLKRLLIAMPSASPYRRQEILNALSAQKIEVLELPNVSEEVDYRSLEMGLKTENFEGFEKTSQHKARDIQILEACRGKTIFISGAGGRIGRKICQKLISFEPAKLILFDQNKTELLKTKDSVQNFAMFSGSKSEIKTKTGCISKIGLLKHLIKREGVQIIINAAYYGDSELTNDNFFDIVSTNILGPINLAEVSIQMGVEQLVLLSNENIMSPRHLLDESQKLAENLVLGISANAKETAINFLRFGATTNPDRDLLSLLEQQIKKQNLVKLPDPEMTRLFFTTTNAVELILYALPFGKELHNKPVHLAKGEPRKVIDFVNKAVDMSGRGLHTKSNPFGVEIKISGLRPGEVLHEVCAYEDLCTPLNGIPGFLIPTETENGRVDHSLLMKSFKTAFALYDEDTLHDLLVGEVPQCSDKILQTA